MTAEGRTMSFPIQFPHPADVIAEEAARFRRLPIAEQAREFSELTDWAMRPSSNPQHDAKVQAIIEELETQWQLAHQRVFQLFGHHRDD